MGIFGRLIPLPSEISAGCGLSWKTKPEEKEKILVFLEEEKLKWEAMYELESVSYTHLTLPTNSLV